MEEGVEQAGLVRRAGEAAIAESGRKARRIASGNALIRLSRSSDSGPPPQPPEFVMPFVYQICASDIAQEMEEGHHVPSIRLAPCCSFAVIFVGRRSAPPIVTDGCRMGRCKICRQNRSDALW